MKKNVNIGCFIDYENKKIVISKEFLRKAGKVGTPEYAELLTAQKSRPGFTLAIRTTKKPTTEKPRLTYKKMEEYLSGLVDAEMNLASYEKVKKLSHIQSSPYNYVRDWFLLTYMGWKWNTEKNRIVPGMDSAVKMDTILSLIENVSDEGEAA